MPYSTTRRWPRLAYLIFAAGYASATYTLTTFSSIPDDVTSKSCQSAYNTPLTDCTPSDFKGKHECSTECRSSINDVQEVIMSKCKGVTVDDSTLLGRALNGYLETVMCASVNSSTDDHEVTSTAAAAASKTQLNEATGTLTVVTKSTSVEAGTASQTTSLVLAGEEPTNLAASTVSTTAEATETSSSGNGRGGDPFANNTSAGAGLAVGYTTLVVSALVCIVAVI